VIPTDLQRGDLIQVEWLDVVEDSIGNPANAKPAHRTSYALFWERKSVNGSEILVTTTTIDKDVPDQQGWCAYPLGMVLSVRVIKRGKRPRAKREKNPAFLCEHANETPRGGVCKCSLDCACRESMCAA